MLPSDASSCAIKKKLKTNNYEHLPTALDICDNGRKFSLKVIGHVSEDKRDFIEEPTEGCHEALTTSGPASLRDSILSDDEDIEPRSHSELIKEKVWTFL